MRHSTFRLVLFLIGIAALAISLTAFVYLRLMIKDTISLRYDFRFEEGVAGLDASPGKIGFGTVPPGGRSQRQFTIAANDDVLVVITARGNGTEYLTVTENDFLLGAGENRSVLLFVRGGEAPNTYAGTINVLLLNPRGRVLARESLPTAEEEEVS